jgi:hypothetical protein
MTLTGNFHRRPIVQATSRASVTNPAQNAAMPSVAAPRGR